MEKKVIDNISFDHNGKHYVIKVSQVGNKYIAEPYLNGMVASPYPYSIVVDNMDNWVFHYGNKPPCVRLLEIVELAIKEGFGRKKDE
jgi:hypothetical protein